MPKKSNSSNDPSPPHPSSSSSSPSNKHLILHAGNLSTLVQALHSRTQALQPLSNAQKRALYYEAERLYNKIKEEFPEEAQNKPLLDALDKLEADLLTITPAQITKKASFRRFLQRMDMLLRITTCSLYLCLLGVITFLPMITIVPIIDGVLKLIGWPPRFLIYELAKKASARGFLKLAGVFYTVSGLQNEYETPAVLLFQHGSNLDGFLILDSYPQFFKSIGKDDIFLMPYVGWMAYVYGIIPINRSQRHEAIKQLGRATRACQGGITVALSPEGTRSKSGQLMRFKKGPFYVQAEAKAKITPLVILGNYELWPPNYMFTCPGQVVMKYLPPVDPATLPPSIGQNKDELSRYIRRQMFEAIHEINTEAEEGKKKGQQQQQTGGPLTWWLRIFNLVYIVLFWLAAYGVWVVVTRVSDGYGWSRGALGGAFVTYTVTVTAGLYLLYCKAPA